MKRSRIGGQSVLAQRRRLADGRCPTHGLIVTPIQQSVFDGENHVGQAARCPRKDCEFVGVLLDAKEVEQPDGAVFHEVPVRPLRKTETCCNPSACAELPGLVAAFNYIHSHRRGYSEREWQRRVARARLNILDTTARALCELLSEIQKHGGLD